MTICLTITDDQILNCIFKHTLYFKMSCLSTLFQTRVETHIQHSKNKLKICINIQKSTSI